MNTPPYKLLTFVLASFSQQVFKVASRLLVHDLGRAVHYQRSAYESWKKNHPYRGNSNRCNLIEHNQFEGRYSTKRGGI